MITIRKYEQTDYEGLMRILSRVYDSKIEKTVLEKEYIDETKDIYVAEEKEEPTIVGDVFVEVKTDFVRPSNILYVTYLAVDENQRGKGVGRQLMEYVENLCKRKQCSAVEFTSADFRTDAHAFYNAIGYSKKKTTHFIKEIRGDCE